MKLSLLAALLAAGVAAGAGIEPDCSAVAGWSQKGDVRTFVPDNLFDYMDGNAEGYILYGFRRMTGITCVSGENSIVIDISEMESPEMAYGIFAANRHPRHDVRKIGAQGQILPSRATFTKGRYYVELAAIGDRDQEDTLEAFAKKVEPMIPGTTDLPSALGWFPKGGLDPDSVRLIPRSVMGLRMLRHGYIASYEQGRAFIVPEDSADAAAVLMGKLRERLNETQAVEVADEAFTGEDRYLGRMCVARKGRYVAGFAALKSGADGAALTSALAARIP